MRVATTYDKQGSEKILRDDIKNLREAVNGIQSIMELEGRTSDPTGFETTTTKVWIWYRTDTNELKAYVNGAVKLVALT